MLKTPHGSLFHALAISGATVALSWTFTHLVFTLHYANIYYRPDDDGPGGLSFRATGRRITGISSITLS